MESVFKMNGGFKTLNCAANRSASHIPHRDSGPLHSKSRRAPTSLLTMLPSMIPLGGLSRSTSEIPATLRGAWTQAEEVESNLPAHCDDH